MEIKQKFNPIIEAIEFAEQMHQITEEIASKSIEISEGAHDLNERAVQIIQEATIKKNQGGQLGTNMPLSAEEDEYINLLFFQTDKASELVHQQLEQSKKAYKISQETANKPIELRAEYQRSSK